MPQKSAENVSDGNESYDKTFFFKDSSDGVSENDVEGEPKAAKMRFITSLALTEAAVDAAKQELDKVFLVILIIIIIPAHIRPTAESSSSEWAVVPTRQCGLWTLHTPSNCFISFPHDDVNRKACLFLCLAVGLYRLG